MSYKEFFYEINMAEEEVILPSEQTHTITATPIKQLIALNGSLVNFDINFQVSSKDSSPFSMVITDQTTLNLGGELDYKYISNGVIRGNLVQDQNEYQEYFIVIKAEQETVIDIHITRNEIQPFSKTSTIHPKHLDASPESPKSLRTFNIIVGIVIAGIVGFLLYSRYSSPTPRVGGKKPSSSSESPVNSYVRRLRNL